MMKTQLKSVATRSALALTVTAALCAATAQPGQAQQPQITVLLNGNPISFDQPPLDINNRVMVPMRRVFEALGARVDFDPDTLTIHATSGPSHIRLKLGSTQAFVNDREADLDVAAQAIDGRTMVPLRFVSEAMGAQVKWSDYNSTVYISTDGMAQPNMAPPMAHPGPHMGEMSMPIELRGIVTSVDSHTGLLMLRGRDGAMHTVHADDAADFHPGDAVHVRGEVRHGIVHATSIDRH